MAEGKKAEVFEDPNIETDESNDNYSSSTTTFGSSLSSSSDTTDDASSSSSSSTNFNGALDDFSELMAQLPIKRGLSKFYQGKSESFTCLSRVTSLEDLAKKENPYNNRRKMMSSKSYAAGLNTYKPYTLHKPIVSKKASSPLQR